MLSWSDSEERRNSIPQCHSEGGWSMPERFQTACWTRGKTYCSCAVESAARATPPAHGRQSDPRSATSGGPRREFRQDSWNQDPAGWHSSTADSSIEQSAASMSGNRAVSWVTGTRPSVGRWSRPPRSLPSTSPQSHRGFSTTRSSVAVSI